MTLELKQIAPQVKTMGETLDQQARSKHTLAQQVKALLKEHATAFAALEERVRRAEQVQEAARFSWLGAAPAGEPLDQYYPPPAGPEAVTILASDGSQIYPDRHAMALYYLINVGAIVYQPGSQSPPDTITSPTLYYKEEDLLDKQGLLISASLVNVKRDLAEIEILANLTAAYQTGQQPVVALIDGRLTLRTIDLPGREQAFYEKQYLKCLAQIQQRQSIIAAYIDRPHSSFVIPLLYLASLKPEAITEDALRHNPFAGLMDSRLFDDLGPGERTAIFNQRAKANVAYAKAGHQVHFFYLNTGSPARPNLVRVEIPVWVAKDPDRLNILHAALLRQARLAGGYPYVLARAHELAVITPHEREALETMLSVSLLRQGQSTSVSQKQHHKNLLGGQESFKL